MAETRNLPRLLDLKGLKCPLPALRTRKTLASLPAGTVLTVLATDPMAAIDIPHLIAETGDRLMAQEESGGVITFTIEKVSRTADFQVRS